jgi:hypothetical protein
MTTIDVSLETSPKKTFASAVDWPGWSRSGKTDELAIESLLAYAERYATVARSAHVRFPARAGLEARVVERNIGSGGTAFGVPSHPSEPDGRPVTAAQADRLARLVEAAWRYFDKVAGAAPAELRKGPRGGGRDTAKIVGHVDAADGAYAHEMGLRIPEATDRRAVLARRRQMLDLLRAPSDGSPLAGRRWPPRYAAHRVAWHALDHAWEIEDRSGPGPEVPATVAAG